MKIADIKKEMLSYRDFYGGDLLGIDEIKSAKSKKELAKIIERHHTHLEDMAIDACHSLGRFKKRLGLVLL